MKQERLNLERPYSPECVEGEFSEVHDSKPLLYPASTP